MLLYSTARILQQNVSIAPQTFTHAVGLHARTRAEKVKRPSKQAFPVEMSLLNLSHRKGCQPLPIEQEQNMEQLTDDNNLMEMHSYDEVAGCIASVMFASSDPACWTVGGL